MREVTLPSGAILKVNPAPFTDAKSLYKAILAEAKDIKIDSKTELASIFKDIFCSSFASDVVESKLWPCMRRCLYNDLKVEESTFEPEKSREDFTQVCMEVAKENVSPFLKNLYAAYSMLSLATSKDPT